MKINALLLLVLGSLFSGCVGVSTLTSSQPQQPINSDGDLVEWMDHLQSYEEGRLRIGVQNDAENVYVAISSSNRSVVQHIMSGGLTVWLNRNGDKSEEMGIKFPLGLDDVNVPGSGRQAQADGESGRNKLIEQTLSQFDLILDDGKARRIPVGSTSHLRLGASYDYGVFSMEMSIPISPLSGSDIAIDPTDGLLFGLGIQTQRASGMRRGSNTPIEGSGADRGSRSGTMGNSGIPVYPPIDLWIAVSLF